MLCLKKKKLAKILLTQFMNDIAVCVFYPVSCAGFMNQNILLFLFLHKSIDVV